MPKILTIIICTYNRNEIISHCLESLKDQIANSTLYDILIVNNYPDKMVSEKLIEISKVAPNIRVIDEKRVGLSHARNKGMNTAQTPWIGYIDDDCRLPENFVQKALEIIEVGEYDSFGGHINNWWLHKKPRWMTKEFGTKPILSDNSTELDKDQFNWGGNMFFKVPVLKQNGGFDVHIGMIANKIGYSAENRVQLRLRENKHIIGYDPDLEVNHLVSKNKLKLSWHLKAAFAEGRDSSPVFPEQYKMRYVVKEVLRLPKTFLLSTWKWVFKADYYWENIVLDLGKATFKIVGKIL